MSNFPLLRYRNFDTWIPEIDIDGTDAPVNILSDVTGFDFKNGYVSNNYTGTAVTLPSNIVTDIADGYDILSSAIFTHSTQGTKFVYILWKTASSSLRIYLDNALLNIDEQNSDVTFVTAPSNINYNLVSDQLKINLNCNATYNDIDGGTSVILNLTLVYLSVKTYVTGAVYQRAAGWYLFPRWLGWSYTDGANITIDATEANLVEDFEDVSHQSWWNGAAAGWADTTSVPISGLTSYVYTYVNLDEPTISYINLDGIFTLKQLKFKYTMTSTVKSTGQDGNVQLINSDRDEIIATAALRITSSDVPLEAVLDTNFFTIDNINGENFHLRFEIPGGFDIKIDDLTLVQFTDCVIVAKNEDGQRGLIKENVALKILADTTMVVLKAEIDWRITEYELYAKKDGIYYKVSSASVAGVWTNAATTVTFPSLEYPVDAEGQLATLNANYNLPEDVRVDNEKTIHSEVYYKGRVYFVRNDFRVYQSHISSNLAIQADSFPYDEDVGFGFFIVSYDKMNKALSISPTNDLIIRTVSSTYIYFVQPSGQGTYKELRLADNSIGLAGVNSITRTLSGISSAPVSFWLDYNGIYFHTGGVGSNIENIIIPTHENYYNGISNAFKDSAIGFYNPVTREYWMSIAGSILVYELPFRKFKKLSILADEFIGMYENVLYYRYGNEIFKYDKVTRSTAVLTTHYNTITEEPENFYKLFQYFYIIFGQSDTTDVIITITADDKTVVSHTVSTLNLSQKLLLPHGYKFNRVKINVALNTANKLIKMKEFGIAYTPDSAEQLGSRV